jgi:hypothetical protein
MFRNHIAKFCLVTRRGRVVVESVKQMARNARVETGEGRGRLRGKHG